MRKLALIMTMLFALTLMSSYAQPRRPRVYYRWHVRLQSLMTRTIRNFFVNATSETAAIKRAKYLARTRWQPANRRGFRLISVRRIGPARIRR